ncbi:MAG: agmatinase [Bacteroidetes bacterium]|nr:agmatinase [Bacteroidota bacterium]
MKELGVKENFLGLGKKYSNYKDSKIVILSAPLEKTVTYGKGTGKAPKEILKASHYVEYYDEEQSREICFERGICTLDQLSFQKLTVEKSLTKIYSEAKNHLSNDKFVVTLGGEHSLSYGAIKAHHEKFPNLSILQIDAHSDLRDSYEDSKYSHACVMARVSEFNTKIVQVGVRAQSIEENEFRKQKQIRTFYSREIKMGMYGDDWQEIVARNLTENVYVTFDLDGFDPSILPATGTPEPGGLFWDETMYLLKIIGLDKNIVGFDVTELAPSKVHPASNYTAAKLVYKILNYAFINR